MKPPSDADHVLAAARAINPKLEDAHKTFDQLLSDVFFERLALEAEADRITQAQHRGRQMALNAAATVPQHKTQPDWELVKPKRFIGYGRPLHNLLTEAYRLGKEKPTPFDVLVAFHKNLPKEIASVILGEELSYYTTQTTNGANGSVARIKTANIKAIAEAIARMTR